MGVIEIAGYVWDMSVVVALIASAVALYSSMRANSIARANLNATMELKIIEFRQSWISELRREMIAYFALVSSRKAKGEITLNKEDHFKSISHAKSIQLLMNPDDEDYSNLLSTMLNLTAWASSDEEVDFDNLDVLHLYTDICQKILKREWERLKSDKKDILNAKNK